MRYGCDPLRTDLVGLRPSDLAEEAIVDDGESLECARLLFPYSRTMTEAPGQGLFSPQAQPFKNSLLVHLTSYV